MHTLVLLNSASPAYTEGSQLILPYLEHLGVPCTRLDLARAPLPSDVAEHALIVVAHRRLDPSGVCLGQAGRLALLAAVRAGSGLVSFDPALPARAELPRSGHQSPQLVGDAMQPTRTSSGVQIEAETVGVTAQPHFITARHASGETLSLVGPLRVPPLAADASAALVTTGGRPLVAATALGQGRVVQWATSDWLHTDILGPLAGLDDVLWRGLVWAARKPFAMRGLPPLVAMRVDDVVGQGTLWRQSPLYWVHTANRHGFRPWLGLFIYNLTEPAINELRDLTQRGQVTAFPHAFGRPVGHGYYYEGALPIRAAMGDAYIYFDHQRGRPLANDEATWRLAAVDAWYAAHAPLPMSCYAIPHWYEMGSNVVAHVHDRWGAEFIGKVQDVDAPLADEVPWLKSGPFRRYEEPGTCLFDPARRGDRPVYYADFVNFGGRRLFNCVTEIRDDAGYEWAPDKDVAATVGRGVRQLRRALDSMALAVLFTHETDYIYKIRPDVWAKEMEQITAGIGGYDPIYVTLDEGVRYVRATRTSRLKSCRCDVATGEITAIFDGYADVPTHFYLFTEAGGEIAPELVGVPAFQGEVVITHKIWR